MGRIRDEAIRQAKLIGLPLAELPDKEADEMRARLANKFTSGRWRRYPWEDLSEEESAQDPHGWRMVDTLLEEDTQHKRYLLFEPEHELTVFALPPGTGVVPLLEECSLWEFYLTNDALEYLVCFNHHDFLIAAGSVAPRLRQLYPSSSVHESNQPGRG